MRWFWTVNITQKHLDNLMATDMQQRVPFCRAAAVHWPVRATGNGSGGGGPARKYATVYAEQPRHYLFMCLCVFEAAFNANPKTRERERDRIIKLTLKKHRSNALFSLRALCSTLTTKTAKSASGIGFGPTHIHTIYWPLAINFWRALRLKTLQITRCCNCLG